MDETVRIVVAYDGGGFHGWQKQPGLPTVEGELRAALGRLIQCSALELEFQGASRTDAGVHAWGQVASFPRQARFEAWDYERALNALTAESIWVRRVEILPGGFNARFDSQGKCYEYRVWNHRYSAPLERHRAWTYGPGLDVARMREAAALLVGEHDFSAFRAADCEASTTVRQIHSIEVIREGDLVRLVVQGNAFMKNMVRILTGTLVEVGEGRRTVASVGEALASGDRRRSGRTAPAHGLCLMEVFYER